jgi:KTSC domain
VTITKLQPVESRAVTAIGYDRQAEEAYVRFVGGGTYAYGRVSPTLWEYFRTATSKGRFVNLVLKPRHPCRRM